MGKVDKLQGINLVRYHLRVNITPANFREEERALWEVIKKGKIDEVMFFVPHAEERSPGLGTKTEIDEMVKILKPIFRRLRKKGVAPSINVWWTVSFSNFADYPRNLRDKFCFRWAVDASGKVSEAVACPACPVWRDYIKRMYQKYAELMPVRIWIDDDMRMTLRADMHSPCFCNVCLDEMYKRTGVKFTRQKLTALILKNPPNYIRNEWLKYQNELACSIIKMLADAVHVRSPKTKVCLMHSHMEIHSAEGRKWDEIVTALGSPKPTFRPSIGPYVETTGIPVIDAFNTTRLAQAALPLETEIAPEIENYPHSTFFKSKAMIKANLELAQLLGIRDMTFSIYRFGGRLDLEIAREDKWSGLLGELKPKLCEIANLDVQQNEIKGVGVYWHEDSAQKARYVENMPKPIFLFRKRPWDNVLPAMGIGIQYGLGNINAFSGENIECLSERQIMEIFSNGVLLDARAAESLLIMGKGELAGLVRRENDVVGSMEIIEDERFGGFSGDVINMRYTSHAWQFKFNKKAKRISKFIGYDGKDKGHGFVLFENSLGGRVVICPFDGQGEEVAGLGLSFRPLESPSFISRSRQAQVISTLEWAAKGTLPIIVSEHPFVYPFLVQKNKRLIVGLWNLMADPLPKTIFKVKTPDFKICNVKMLSENGKWEKMKSEISIEGGYMRIKVNISLKYLETCIIVMDG